jgi:hypothetical protein
MSSSPLTAKDILSPSELDSPARKKKIDVAHN